MNQAARKRELVLQKGKGAVRSERLERMALLVAAYSLTEWHMAQNPACCTAAQTIPRGQKSPP
jgi:hypothetical protein